MMTPPARGVAVLVAVAVVVAVKVAVGVLVLVNVDVNVTLGVAVGVLVNAMTVNTAPVSDDAPVVWMFRPEFWPWPVKLDALNVA